MYIKDIFGCLIPKCNRRKQSYGQRIKPYIRLNDRKWVQLIEVTKFEIDVGRRQSVATANHKQNELNIGIVGTGQLTSMAFYKSKNAKPTRTIGMYEDATPTQNYIAAIAI